MIMAPRLAACQAIGHVTDLHPSLISQIYTSPLAGWVAARKSRTSSNQIQEYKTHSPSFALTFLFSAWENHPEHVDVRVWKAKCFVDDWTRVLNRPGARCPRWCLRGPWSCCLSARLGHAVPQKAEHHTAPWDTSSPPLPWGSSEQRGKKTTAFTERRIKWRGLLGKRDIYKRRQLREWQMSSQAGAVKLEEKVRKSSRLSVRWDA